MQLGSEDNSSVVSIVTKDEANSINCIALSDLLDKHFHWMLNKTMNPTGCHLAVTVANCKNYQKFIDALKHCVKMMKEDPALNKSSNATIYGMSSSIPENSVMGDVLKFYNSALLDVLP